MKRYAVIYLSLFLTICMQSCQEAELPMADFAKVDISATWENYGFSLSANVEKSNDVTILEKGFVFMYPDFSDWYSWEDYDVKKEVYVLKNADEFRCIVDKVLPENMPCQAYSYVKTNVGDFRSEYIGLHTGNLPTPIIHSITHEQDCIVPYSSRKGFLHIEGTNFLGKSNWVDIIIKDDENKALNIEIIKTTETSIIASYDSYDWRRIGKFPMTIKIAGKVVVSSNELFEVKGTVLKSIEPNAFKYGDIVTLHLDNYKMNEDFSLYGISRYSLISQSENGIVLRLFPDMSGELKFRYYDERHRYSDELPIWILNPWKKIGNWDVAIGYNASSYFAYRDCIYTYDWGIDKLIAYSPNSQTIDEILFESAINDTSDLINMFAIGNYLYFVLRKQSWEVDNQELHRYDLSTKEWMKLNDVTEDIDNSIYGNIVVWDEHTVYAKDSYGRIVKYNVDEDSWQYHLFTIPNHSNLIGRYGDYLYYEYNRCIYRVALSDTANKELVFKDYLIDNIEKIVLFEKYIYFKSGKGLFKIDLSKSPLVMETMGGDIQQNQNAEFSITRSGCYLFHQGGVFKYTEK